ncbi:MAG: DUF2442 domain-containing protein [Bacteroidales bacterium]|nr:DUF2442 domain-containing protein [Bacteroidales bacterium]
MNNLLTIDKAEYLDGYKIMATFNNGETKLLDFTSIIEQAKGICVKLKDINYFKSFRLDPFTIDWNNEIGFAPEFLYEIGKA